MSELFTDAEIAELRTLVRGESKAYWETGDWLVNRSTSTTIDYHNGRNAAIRDAAAKIGISSDTLLNRYTASRVFPPDERQADIGWSIHYEFAKQGADVASDWLEEFIESGAARTKSVAIDWISKRRKFGEGVTDGLADEGGTPDTPDVPETSSGAQDDVSDPPSGDIGAVIGQVERLAEILPLFDLLKSKIRALAPWNEEQKSELNVHVAQLLDAIDAPNPPPSIIDAGPAPLAERL